MIRKYISICLLVVFMFDAGGFIFGWHLRQWIHTVVIDNFIHSGTFSTDLTVIHLTKDQFDAVKIHDREFKLNNAMYDVVWNEQNGNELTLYCFRDTGEENLIIEFIGFIAKKTSESNSPINITMQSLLVGFCFFTPELTVQVHLRSAKQELPFAMLREPLFQSKRVDIPPPRTFSV